MISIKRITQSGYNKLKQLVYTIVSARGTFTAEEYGPYGMDSRAPKDAASLYAPTERDGDECIIGVLNKGRKAEIGEVRLFCTDAQGNFKFNVWLRADGTLLQGDSEEPGDFTNFAVKHNELKADLDELKATVNANAAVFNAHTHVLALSAGTGTAAPSVTQEQNNNTDFSNIKNEKIKTN